MTYEGIIFGQFVPKIKNDEGKSLMIVQMVDINEAEMIKFFIPLEDYKKLAVKQFINRDAQNLKVVGIETDDTGEYPNVISISQIGEVTFEMKEKQSKVTP